MPLITSVINNALPAGCRMRFCLDNFINFKPA